MDLTKEMKKKHAALIKEKAKIDSVLRGVEAYLDAVKTESEADKKAHSTKRVERVMRLPNRVVNSNVEKPQQGGKSDSNSLFKWEA
jgi:hypothetical protein